MKFHLLEQVSKYGDQVLVNLINQKGYERPVKDAYERYVSQVGDLFSSPTLSLLILPKLNLPNVRYQYFDFHHECRNMRWDRISVLIDKIRDELDNQGCVGYDCPFQFICDKIMLAISTSMKGRPSSPSRERSELTAWITLIGRTWCKLLWQSGLLIKCSGTLVLFPIVQALMITKRSAKISENVG